MIFGPQLYNEQFQIYIVMSEERWKKNLKTLTKQNTMNSEKEMLTCPSEEVEGVERRAGGIPEHPLQNVSTLSLGGALWASAQRLCVSLPCCQLVCRVLFFFYSFVYLFILVCLFMGFLGGSDGKESACNSGDLGSIPELGRSLGEGNGNPLQYSCLENPMDRGTWRATVHGVTQSWTWLSTNTFTYLFI